MKKLFSITLMALTAMSLHARIINIHGTVTMQGSGEPVAGVSIYIPEPYKFLGITDEEGRYMVTADSEGELGFSHQSCQEYSEKIDGRLAIDVALMHEAKLLDEVVVEGKSGKATLITEPTDIEVSGNHLKLKTTVRIPRKLFNSQVRMIIQPAIYHVTKKHLTYLTPIMYDGWRYADTQERMYDWDKSKDTLTPYQQIKQIPRREKNVAVRINDSLYVDNPKDDYMFAILSSLENYNRIIYTDTIELARGTVNPLRHLDYKLLPMTMNEEKYLPTPEVELRDADGEMNLIFPVGKSNLDLALGNNAEQMNALISEFKTIEDDPNMTLKSFNIYGFASPEGRYESNRRLASERMNSAMELVLQSIDPTMRRNAEITSDAEVAPWEDIVGMLRADSLFEESDKVQEIIDKYSGRDARSAAMTRLPFYRSLLTEKYLPRLRRVSYHIVSSRYRPLTDEEIAALYVSNPSELSRYQFYRYYTSCEGEKREEAMRRALSKYPGFVVAATDLSHLMLSRGENPIDVLKPFFDDPAKWKELPVSMRYNMGVACLDTSRYSLADSIFSVVPDMKETHKAKIYCAAFNGRFREVMQEICEDSPLNEVLMLLAIKDDKMAALRAEKLGNSAIEEYVKAIAANRIDDYLTAITHLENAFRLDPSLKEVAKIDGDLIDLIEEEDLINDDTDNTDNGNDNNDDK